MCYLDFKDFTILKEAIPYSCAGKIRGTYVLRMETGSTSIPYFFHLTKAEFESYELWCKNVSSYSDILLREPIASAAVGWNKAHGLE